MCHIWAEFKISIQKSEFTNENEEMVKVSREK